MKIFGKNRKIAYIIYLGIAIIFITVNAILSIFGEKEEKTEVVNNSYSQNGERNINFKKRYHGVVIKKFNDTHNHNYETIEINLSSESYFYLHPFQNDKTGFYDFIQKDDSIFKEDWGYTFRIKRENIDTTFIIHPDYVDLK